MIELNKEYSTKEFVEALEISESTWKHKRAFIIDEIKKVCTLETRYYGRAQFFTITEMHGELNLLQKKKNKNRKNDKTKREKAIVKEIYNEISLHPYHTGKSLNFAIRKSTKNELILSRAENTTYKDVLKCKKIMFGKRKNCPGTHGLISDFVLCKQISSCLYEPMNENEVEEYNKILNQCEIWAKENEEEIKGEYDSDLISYKEYREQLSDNRAEMYDRVESMFACLFNFIPKRIAYHEPGIVFISPEDMEKILRGESFIINLNGEVEIEEGE